MESPMNEARPSGGVDLIESLSSWEMPEHTYCSTTVSLDDRMPL